MTDETPLDPLVSPAWGSDAIAGALWTLGVPFIALNPGSSFRGLHDSLVNYLGNVRPEILLCLHEEHAVAIAHGYAKVTGRAMAAAVHTNVGLMHASMAIYNAWCDRAPMLVLGGSGPLDEALRKPWIDWIHASDDPAALIRSFVKFDALPRSVPDAVAALERAWEIARTEPQGPTYVCVETPLQEVSVVGGDSGGRSIAPSTDPQTTRPAEGSIAEAVRLLSAATAPVILAGRVSRDLDDWDRRVRLAERLGARVVTDIKTAAAFPTEHPLHVPGPGYFPSVEARAVLARADVILSLDWIDVAGTLSLVGWASGHPALIEVGATAGGADRGSDALFAATRANVVLTGSPDAVAARLLERIPERIAPVGTAVDAPSAPHEAAVSAVRAGSLTLPDLARSLQAATAEDTVCLLRVPIGWESRAWPFRHPLDYIGYDGGAGIGSGPGTAIGAALALRGSGRLPVAILGDGDLLMGMSALWTAAHHRIPLLIVVANNRSYFSDVEQQERIALQRGRDPSRKWIGQRIDDPALDLAGLARAQGFEAWGPVSGRDDLDAALAEAVAAVRAGASALVDAVLETGD